MDNPRRQTLDENKHNIRELVRGGMLREVWDELDENGNIEKTAVWDIRDRNGRPLGEQSWDEYERYIDLLRGEAELVKKNAIISKKRSQEERDRIHAEALKKREAKIRKNRDEVASVLEYYLEDYPEPFNQIPFYRLYAKLLPYAEKLKIANFTQRRLASIMTTNKDYFKAMGFTYNKAWGYLTRTEVTYIGYQSEILDSDKRKRSNKYEQIREALEPVEVGRIYHRLDLARIVAKSIPEANVTNLSWILARNADKFDLIYDHVHETLTKNGKWKK